MGICLQRLVLLGWCTFVEGGGGSVWVDTSKTAAFKLLLYKVVVGIVGL